MDSFINSETFIQYEFSKLLSTNILLFKECKYILSIKIFKNTISKFFMFCNKRIVTDIQSKINFRKNFQFLVLKFIGKYW
jgi:hypothetical protein